MSGATGPIKPLDPSFNSFNHFSKNLKKQQNIEILLIFNNSIIEKRFYQNNTPKYTFHGKGQTFEQKKAPARNDPERST